MPWGEIERESVPCLSACLPACRLPPACLPACLLPCLAWGFLALLISHPRCLARATCAAQVPFQTSCWLQCTYWIPVRQLIPQHFILEIRASPRNEMSPTRCAECAAGQLSVSQSYETPTMELYRSLGRTRLQTLSVL